MKFKVTVNDVQIGKKLILETRKDVDAVIDMHHHVQTKVSDKSPVWYVIWLEDENGMSYPVDKVCIVDEHYEGEVLYFPEKHESKINSYYDEASDDERRDVLDITWESE